MALLHVESPGVPPLQRGVQWYSDILAYHSITELQIHAADDLGTSATLLLQPEQMMKKVQVGKNSEIRLTEMDKDRHVQDSVWVEVAQTDSPELQQIPQERMNGNPNLHQK